MDSELKLVLEILTPLLAVAAWGWKNIKNDIKDLKLDIKDLSKDVVKIKTELGIIKFIVNHEDYSEIITEED